MKITELEQMWWHRLSKALYKFGGTITIVLSIFMIAVKLNEAFRVEQRDVRIAISDIKNELIIIENQLHNSGFDKIEASLIKLGVEKPKQPNSGFRPLFIIDSLTDVFLTVGLGNLLLDPERLDEELHRTSRETETYIETKRKLLLTIEAYKTAPNKQGVAVIETLKFSGSTSIRLEQLKRQLTGLLDRQAILHKASNNLFSKLLVQSGKHKVEFFWLFLIPFYYIGLWFLYRRIFIYTVYGNIEG